MVEHLYSPELAPSDFHLFGPFEQHLDNKRVTENDVEQVAGRAAQKFIQQTLGHCILVKTVEKQNYFPSFIICVHYLRTYFIVISLIAP